MTDWFDAGALADLATRGRRVFKAGRKQILLVKDGDRIFACNNRCPHEGYPLSEGTLGPACVLTCNWHNWKFNLGTGETLVGGDRLRQYPVEIRDGHVFVDVTADRASEVQARALSSLADAVEDNDYERMAREIARFLRAGGDALEPLRQTIISRASRLEYGMDHAFAAAAEWIGLYNRAENETQALVALVEPVAHIAFDTLREGEFPYGEALAAWDEDTLVDCIEREDEAGAVARLRGALHDGARVLPSLKAAFARAALAHYQGFGHSAIYTTKAFELIDRLGPTVALPVLQSLVRSLIYASREDRIPEFRHYAKVLAKGPALARNLETARDLVGLSINTSLERVAAMAGGDEEKYRVLLEASAIAMLRFDMSVDLHRDKSVSHNVRWLDFTHMLTFGNAARKLCAWVPSLWPQVQLQMACFLGRNAPFLLAEADGRWRVDDAAAFFGRERQALYDHGIREPIFACHRVKTLAAVEEEVAWAGEGALSSTVLAATNRYLNNPIKNHHATRAAQQALAFVEAEG